MFVRTDIPIVNQIVQVGHVCYEAGLKFDANDNTYLVLFQCESEDELKKTEYWLNSRGVETHIFFEPDNNMGYSALCTQPVSGSLRKIFRRYKLYKI